MINTKSKNYIKMYCVNCGMELDRFVSVKNPHCFNCKIVKHKQDYLKRKVKKHKPKTMPNVSSLKEWLNIF